MVVVTAIVWVFVVVDRVVDVVVARRHHRRRNEVLEPLRRYPVRTELLVMSDHSAATASDAVLKADLLLLLLELVLLMHAAEMGDDVRTARSVVVVVVHVGHLSAAVLVELLDVIGQCDRLYVVETQQAHRKP